MPICVCSDWLDKEAQAPRYISNVVLFMLDMPSPLLGLSIVLSPRLCCESLLMENWDAKHDVDAMTVPTWKTASSTTQCVPAIIANDALATDTVVST